MIERRNTKPLTETQEHKTQPLESQYTGHNHRRHCSRIDVEVNIHSSRQWFAGAVGQSFTRALAKDSELKEAYSILVGHEAKQNFRLNWAKLELREAEKKAIKTKSHTKEQKVVGTYMPFRRLWDHEGQDRAGFKALCHKRFNQNRSCCPQSQS
jgi:hypothetical protein